MCEICRQIPCPAGCPNAPDSPALMKCSCCNEEIRAGEEYAPAPDDSPICMSCIESMDAVDLLEAMSIDIKTAMPNE